MKWINFKKQLEKFEKMKAAYKTTMNLVDQLIRQKNALFVENLSLKRQLDRCLCKAKQIKEESDKTLGRL